MKQLESFSIGAPGFYGLNSQDSGVSIDPGFATVANNLVVDKFGRLAARKGWVNKSRPSIATVDNINKSNLVSYYGSSSNPAGSTIIGGESLPNSWWHETNVGNWTPQDPRYYRKRRDFDGNSFNDPELNALSYYLYAYLNGAPSGSGTPLSTLQRQWIESYVIQPLLTSYNNNGSFGSLIIDPIFSGEPIRFLAEHVDADDVVTFLSGANNEIKEGGVDTFFTDITPAGYTINDNDWSACNLLGISLLFQRGYEPLVYDNVATTVLQPITDYLNTEKGITTVQNYGSNYPVSAITAYGRIWSFTDDTIFWSTDIADSAFPCFCGGTSGSLNIASVLPKNVDKITGLAIHNDLLIIFCARNIVIYQGAINPIGSSFSLYDVITGVGCSTHKSIQNVGNDLIFLSDTGIRSLGRLITEKSLPLRELTTNISNALLADVTQEAALYDGTLDHVCSVYSEKEGFYLLSLPALGFVYCLDTRKALPDGTAKITKWVDFSCYSLLRTRDRRILLGEIDVIGLYDGYSDNGENYTVSLLSSYNSLQSPSTLKMLKKLKAFIIGGSGQTFFLKAVTDFGKEDISIPVSLESTSVVSEFNVAEYNLGEYSGASNDIQIKAEPFYGSGSIVQLGFDADISNQPFSVQKMDLLYKTGRNN